MVDQLRAVIDTNVLTKAIIEGSAPDAQTLDLVLSRSLLFYATSAILREYYYVFGLPQTTIGIPITIDHRGRLNPVLEQAIWANNYPPSGQVTHLHERLDDNRDRKFLTASDQVSTRVHGLCYLLTNDYHLTDLAPDLVAHDILVQTPTKFLNNAI